MKVKENSCDFSKVEVKKVEQKGIKMLEYMYNGSYSIKILPEAEHSRNIKHKIGQLLCKTSGQYAPRFNSCNIDWLEQCLKTL